MLHKQQTKIPQTVDKNWKQRKTNFHLPVCRIWEGDDDIWKVIKVSKSVFLRLSLSLFLRLSLSPSVSFSVCLFLSLWQSLFLRLPQSLLSICFSVSFISVLCCSFTAGHASFFPRYRVNKKFFFFSNGLIVSHASLPSLQPCWINFSPPAVVGWQH